MKIKPPTPNDPILKRKRRSHVRVPEIPIGRARPRGKILKTKKIAERREAGRTVANSPTTPRQVGLPPYPSVQRAADPEAYDEQMVARTEILMLKGVRDRYQLMKLLDVSPRGQMDRYIQRVMARWEVFGMGANVARARGEALARLDNIETNIWQIIQGRENGGPGPKIAMQGMRHLLEVNRQRSELHGLSSRVIERLSHDDPSQVYGPPALDSHEALSRFAEKFYDMAERMLRERRVIEHVSEATDAAS